MSVVDGAAHTQKMMWRVTEAPWRMLQRSLCCSFATFSRMYGKISAKSTVYAYVCMVWANPILCIVIVLTHMLCTRISDGEICKSFYNIYIP